MTLRIRFVSASAGSGKTYHVTETIEQRLMSGACRPSGLIATTFTVKAAQELQDRIRRRLYDSNNGLAERLDEGLIGTVHSMCRGLLERFAFAAGISPSIEILPADQAAVLLAQAVESVADFSTLRRLQQVATLLGQQNRQKYEFNWKSQVREIIDAVEANDFAPEQLPGMAEQSIVELTAFLPRSVLSDLDADLLSAFNTAIERIRHNGDDTQGTRKYLQFLRDSQRDLENGALRWSDWVKLAKEQPTKLSQVDAAPVAAVAARFENHPRLRDNIREYTATLFTLAQRAIAEYQRRKEERGWVDFADLEKRTLHLLRDVASVKEILRDEIDLLVVDEFQDTSPIQLGLLMELAACSHETIWVGDVKQAIYGFRNSDPALVNAVVAEVQKAGGLADSLGNSYRSVPDLVRLNNALFVPAFASSLGLPEEHVRLAAQRESIQPHQNAVELLELSNGQKGKNGKAKRLTNEDFAAALAERLHQWMNAPQCLRVEDKETKRVRSLGFRDIAILCRTNDDAASMAASLSARGLPASLAQAGLMATPEARLALACLRRLADPADTLATAEIIALQATLTPEQWLTQRFEYLDELARRRKTANTPVADRWGIEESGANSVVQGLEKARRHLSAASPPEALDMALEAGEVFATITGWGPSAARVAQRRANVESLRALARQHEEACGTNHLPGTVAGFIFWCDDLAHAKVDAKGIDDQINAVHVSTYHQAKGLEWPVVVCTGFDDESMPRLWGLTLAPHDDEKPFNMNQPLANRRLRFWTWPFGGQGTGIPLSARADASAVGRNAARVANEEALRLLYVGLTRARDLLVIAKDKARPTPWLDLLGPKCFQPAGAKLRFSDGATVPVTSVTITLPQTTLPATPEPVYAWFPSPVLRVDRPSARLTPSQQPAVGNASIGRIIELGARLPFTGKPDDADLGDALHAILSAEFVQPGHSSRRPTVERLIHAYGLGSLFQAQDVLAMVDRFRSTILREFHPKSVLVEVPFGVRNETGQRISGFLDLLLETEDGWLIIDHKSFPGSSADWKAKALSFSGQLSCYRRAVVATGRRFASAWIHFAVGGGMVQLKMNS